MKKLTGIKLTLIILLLVGVIILLVFIRFNGSSINNQKPINNTTPSASSASTIPGNEPALNIAVESYTPNEDVPLSPGQTQQFTISFTTAVKLTDLNIKLNQKNYADDSKDSAATPISFTQTSPQTIQINTSGPIEGYQEYTMTITNTQNSVTIRNLRYLSETKTVQRNPTNNLALATFLPYSASNYLLTYSEKDNLYYSHFIFNPNSTENLDLQFERAKQEALLFVQSKNIDINSIKVEWRYK